jgi:hypothetical protein
MLLPGSLAAIYDDQELSETLGSPEAPPVVLVIDPDPRRGASVASQVRALDGGARILVLPPDERVRATIRDDSEVMLVDVAGGAPVIGFATSVVATHPSLHAVFITDDQFRPEAEALRGLGAKYVLVETHLWGWLAAALHPLSHHARARRQLAAAERTIPPVPRGLPLADPALPLPVAEQRFRESYLRCVLSRTTSHKAAASLAGVPYTTLRSMVEKLLL